MIMDKSKFLSQVIGIYMLIISISMLINMPQFIINIVELINNPSLMFAVGFFTLIPGVLLVVSHNIWEMSWRVLVTLIGWLVLFKAVCIIYCPQSIDAMS